MRFCVTELAIRLNSSYQVLSDPQSQSELLSTTERKTERLTSLQNFVQIRSETECSFENLVWYIFFIEVNHHCVCVDVVDSDGFRKRGKSGAPDANQRSEWFRFRPVAALEYTDELLRLSSCDRICAALLQINRQVYSSVMNESVRWSF